MNSSTRYSLEAPAESLYQVGLFTSALSYARQCVNTPWTQGPRTYCHVFPAVALALLLCPFSLQVFLSSLRSPLQLTNPDRGLLLATGSLLVYYVTPQLFRPFTSTLFPSSPSRVPSSPSWVPFYHHKSRLIFHGPLPSIQVPSSPSWVPFHFHGSPSIFTGPLPFSRVPSSPSRIPFYFHRSPSIFTGPLLSFTGLLLSSRDPSDESLSQLLSHVTIYRDFCPMYYDF